MTQQYPKHVKTVIHFTDHGQDFLEWHLSAKGTVIACKPKDDWIWLGCTVDVSNIRRGEPLNYYNPRTESSNVIRYPVTKVVAVNKGGVTAWQV